MAATYIAAGAKEVEMPNIIDRRRQLEEMLDAEPEVVTPSKAHIREALGLPRAS